MTEVLRYLENAGAIAFVLLGLVTAISWARRRDRSLGFLVLAIGVHHQAQQFQLRRKSKVVA